MLGSGTGPVPIRPFSDWKKTWTDGGTKSATSVGMPMPRFTSMPSRSSRAMRLAITVCASMVSFLRDDVIHQGSGGDDMVGGDHADGNDVFRGGDDGRG